MTDNRLDQIQDVLAELVRIAGNTNAAVEELRADVAELKANQQRLDKNQQLLLENQQTLEENLAQFAQETNENFEELNEKMDYTLLQLTKHEVKLLANAYKRKAK